MDNIITVCRGDVEMACNDNPDGLIELAKYGWSVGSLEQQKAKADAIEKAEKEAAEAQAKIDNPAPEKAKAK